MLLESRTVWQYIQNVCETASIFSTCDFNTWEAYNICDGVCTRVHD